MKRIANLVVLVLATNFVLAAGGIGWLASSGHLTKPRVGEIRRVLFPPPATQPSGPATRPAVAIAPTDPADRLGDFVARAAGRPPATDGSIADRPSSDVILADLDGRRRELLDLQQQVELGQAQLTHDRDVLTKDRAAFTAQRDGAAAAAADQGFQQSLALYETLPPRQIKSIFATLPDDEVQRYLQAMDAKQAAKVMKEFKSPAETERLQHLLERIRTAQATTTTRPAAAEPTAALPDGR